MTAPGEFFGRVGDVTVYSDGHWTWEPETADYARVSRQVLDALLTTSRDAPLVAPRLRDQLADARAAIQRVEALCDTADRTATNLVTDEVRAALGSAATPRFRAT